MNRYFECYNGSGGGEGTLSTLCRDLAREQLKSWPLYQENCAALKSVRTRTVDCGGYEVRLQYNPKRIVSTAAPADPARKSCFLCSDNLPEPQLGIQYRDRYMILCNPMPIFEHHFTIASTHHVPQSLSIPDLLLLSRDLGSDYVGFYNGPRCGASAPDHLHFQACPSYNFFKLEGLPPADPVLTVGGTRIYSPEGIGRGAAVFEDSCPDSLGGVIEKFLSASRAFLPGDGEPMVNVISSYSEGEWKIVIFPRIKHRPDCYYGKNGRSILVSPGAIDMSGLIILPLEVDFDQIKDQDIQKIYEETSADSRTVRRIIGIMDN